MSVVYTATVACHARNSTSQCSLGCHFFKDSVCSSLLPFSVTHPPAELVRSINSGHVWDVGGSHVWLRSHDLWLVHFHQLVSLDNELSVTEVRTFVNSLRIMIQQQSGILFLTQLSMDGHAIASRAWCSAVLFTNNTVSKTYCSASCHRFLRGVGWGGGY